MIKVKIKTNRINRRLKDFMKQVYPMVKQQIYKGAMDYTPWLDHNLIDSAQPSSVDPTPYLIYNIVYARYQYYVGKRGEEKAPPDTNDFPGRTKIYHPLAQCMWVDKYLDTGGRRDIARLCQHPDRYLRF